MSQRMKTILKDWENSSKELVLVEGLGDKAFCSGGDLLMAATLENLTVEERDSYVTSIHHECYSLGYVISRLKLPLIVLMNNMVIGLASAIALQAKYKIVTERSLYVMPEVSIGYFPDGTACYTFPRLKNYIGFLLGLTGYRLKGIDIIHAGIGTHFVPSDKLEDLKKELLQSHSSDIETILNKYHVNTSMDQFNLTPYIDKIENCFSAPTVEEIIERLRKDESDWAKNIVHIMKQGSPTSLKATLCILQRGKESDLAECARMECRMGSTFLTKDSDFFKGIRFLLSNKHEIPQWDPKRLEDITMDSIAKRLELLPLERELKLQVWK